MQRGSTAHKHGEMSPRRKTTYVLWVHTRLWLPPILWMALIFWLSAQSQLPGIAVTWLDWVLKHTGHFVGYAVLAWLWWRAARQSLRDRRVAAVLALTGAFLYAIFDELHQSFVPGRDASLLDITIDASGAASAVGMILWRSPNGYQAETTRPTTAVDSH